MENQVNKEQILDWYMNDVLESKDIQNTYQFCKLHEISEQEFYQFFGNLDKIEPYFFEVLMHKTIETLHSSEDYTHYEAKDKLLSFYYTFFGNLTANRSFVTHILEQRELKTLQKLSSLRAKFQDFIHEIEFDKIDFKQKDINKFQDKAMEEAAWVQLLATIKFWMNDESANFEKTDVFIEKSLNAGFELMNVNAFKNVADFGKFLFKEIKK